jgi:hypothetical protein
MNIGLLLVAAIAIVFAGERAAVGAIYLQFSGSDAGGKVDGVSYSSASWLLELEFDPSTPDVSALVDQGRFVGAISSARIQINGDLFELGGGSAQGHLITRQLSLLTPPASGNHFVVNPASGGFLQFITGPNQVFPNLFGDHEDLGSAVIGATLVDDTTTSFPNQYSMIEFKGTSALVGAGGETIEITEEAGVASGDFRMTVSDVSAFAAQVVPEPASVGVWCVLGLTICCAAAFKSRR